MDFHPHEPFDDNRGQRVVWNQLKAAFGRDEGHAFYRYPIFSRSGRIHREPDILLLHRALGVWVLEVKGCRIEQIEGIYGQEWRMRDWHSEEETPVAQAEDQAHAVRSQLEAQRELRGRVYPEWRVVLPFVTRAEWTARGFDRNPSARGVVLLEEDLEPGALRAHLEQAMAESPTKPLDDARYALAQQVLFSEVRRPAPRAIPTGTPPQSPARVLHAIEKRFCALDKHQHRIAFEIPEGPQRIRGLPGAGKTVLLAKRAAKIHVRHPDWDVGFVFFTRALYGHIRGLLSSFVRELCGQEPDWRKLHVLHAWGAKEENGFYRHAARAWGETPLSLDAVRKELSSPTPEEAFAFACARLDERAASPPPLFDALLIDEGQDLPPAFYRLAHKALTDEKRLYWAYDEAQGIGSLIVPEPKAVFGTREDGAPVVDLGGARLPDGSISGPVYDGGIAKAHNLNRSYRTPRLLLMAGHALNMGLLRRGGPLQGVTEKSEWESLGYRIVDGDFSNASVSSGRIVRLTRPDALSPHPVDDKSSPLGLSPDDVLRFRACDSDRDEQRFLADRLKADLDAGLTPEDLLVVTLWSPGATDWLVALGEACEARGIPVCIPGVSHDRSTFRAPGHVTLTHSFRAKGNEAWKVYACRLHLVDAQRRARGETELHKRNEALVALTRARLWCVATGLGSPVLEELSRVHASYPHVAFPAFNRRELRRVMGDERQGELFG